MGMESGDYARLSAAVALLGIALVSRSVQGDLAFGQAGGTAVTDVCEPTARDVDFNADEEINFGDFAWLAQHWQGADGATDVALGRPGIAPWISMTFRS